jgi:hypothetical protein
MSRRAPSRWTLLVAAGALAALLGPGDPAGAREPEDAEADPGSAPDPGDEVWLEGEIEAREEPDPAGESSDPAPGRFAENDPPAVEESEGAERDPRSGRLAEDALSLRVRQLLALRARLREP